MHKQAVEKWPDTYAGYDAAVLIAAFAAAPGRLRESISGLGEAELTARPRPGKWSIKEIVPHVTDSEVVATFRMRMTWAQQDVVWPVYDQDVWAREHDYQNLSAAELENSLKLFAALRAATEPLLRRAADEDWRKHGVHPQLGPMTLRHLLELYADHAEGHIDQILETRALIGRPLDMPPVLERRLF